MGTAFSCPNLFGIRRSTDTLALFAVVIAASHSGFSAINRATCVTLKFDAPSRLPPLANTLESRNNGGARLGRNKAWRLTCTLVFSQIAESSRLGWTKTVSSPCRISAAVTPTPSEIRLPHATRLGLKEGNVSLVCGNTQRLYTLLPSTILTLNMPLKLYLVAAPTGSITCLFGGAYITLIPAPPLPRTATGLRVVGLPFTICRPRLTYTVGWRMG